MLPISATPQKTLEPVYPIESRLAAEAFSHSETSLHACSSVMSVVGSQRTVSINVVMSVYGRHGGGEVGGEVGGGEVNSANSAQLLKSSVAHASAAAASEAHV